MNTWGLMALLYVASSPWPGLIRRSSPPRSLPASRRFTATIMSANVFFIIIPNQKIVVADLIAGRTPDPKYGAIAKQRSLHNNYLTLPVIFFMLSNHYRWPSARKYNWIIAALSSSWASQSATGSIPPTPRTKGKPTWTWALTAIIFILIMWLSTVPKCSAAVRTIQARSHPAFQRFAGDPHFNAAKDVIGTRCMMCHTAEPAYEGIARAPRASL